MAAKKGKMMPESTLATYLKNHLAGSGAELELARRAATSFADSEDASFFTAYVNRIEEDRKAMGELLRAAGSRDDTLKKIGRWAMERVVVSRLSDFTGTAAEFSRLVEIEGALIGCMGRQWLWDVIEKANITEAATLDVAHFGKKAGEDAKVLQRILMSLAERAFRDSPGR